MAPPKLTMRSASDLVPYARNARTHSEQKISMIAGSIREFGFRNPVLVDGDNGIIAGHARVQAALQLGLPKVPCVDCSDMSDTQRRAYTLADNQLALHAGWDQELLSMELSDLTELDVDIESLGFTDGELETLSNGSGDDEDRYTQKIESPIYEPTGEQPAIEDLFDATKAVDLQTEINSADLPDEIADFLRLAATRHTVFNFAKIAEFYAHANAGTQSLMERSALVIIDYDKAIDQGFVKLAGVVEHEYEAISS